MSFKISSSDDWKNLLVEYNFYSWSFWLRHGLTIFRSHEGYEASEFEKNKETRRFISYWPHRYEAGRTMEWEYDRVIYDGETWPEE